MDDAVDDAATQGAITVYVTSWCGSCRSALRFLNEREIDHTTIDIDEDEAGAELVMGLNRGNRSVPTILVDGEHILTEPSRAELAEAFGDGAHEAP